MVYIVHIMNVQFWYLLKFYLQAPHTQGKTVECLSSNVKELDEKCKKEILRIAELQADDYHMDRPLFYACREDRERFCAKAKAGGGKIYRCLFRHKFDRGMSTEVSDDWLLFRSNISQAFKLKCKKAWLLKDHLCNLLRLFILHVLLVEMTEF